MDTPNTIHRIYKIYKNNKIRIHVFHCPLALLTTQYLIDYQQIKLK